jgi:hypothetical protein
MPLDLNAVVTWISQEVEPVSEEGSSVDQLRLRGASWA